MKESDGLKKAYGFTSLVSRLFSIPGVTTQTHLTYGTDHALSYLHLVIPIIPFVLTMAKSQENYDSWTYASNALNELSLGIVSFQNGNWFGIYSAFCHFLAEFWARKQDFGEDIPAEMIHNLTMLLYLYLAYHTLCVRKIDDSSIFDCFYK